MQALPPLICVGVA